MYVGCLLEVSPVLHLKPQEALGPEWWGILGLGFGSQAGSV